MSVVAGLPAAHGVLFLGRSNRPLLDLLEYLYSDGAAAWGQLGRTVRWASPALYTQLEPMVFAPAVPYATLGGMLVAAERFDPTGGRGPVDPTVLRILRTAVRLEGSLGAVEGSPWLEFVGAALRPSEKEAPNANGDRKPTYSMLR